MTLFSRFLIPTLLGLIGCVLAASLPPPPLHLIGLPGLKSNHLPISGYIFYVPNTSLAVRFQEYLTPSDIFVIKRILEKAKTDVLRHAKHDSMGTAEVVYKSSGPEHSETVALRLFPMVLTWGQWGQVVEVLQDFFELWGCVGFYFDVVNIARRDFPMANGILQWDSLVGE